MEKLYYSISEVCELLKIKAHHIRYWESEIPQLKTSTKTGYSRKYTAKDIEVLRKIRDLIFDRKFSLEGAAKEIKRRKKLPEDDSGEPISTPISSSSLQIDLADLKRELLAIRDLLKKKS